MIDIYGWRFLISRCCKPWKNSCLHLAAEGGYSNTVSLLLDAGADVEMANLPNNWTPLHGAAKHNRVGVISLILDKGAMIDRRTKRNLTALYIAIIFKRAESTRLLISRGASLNLAKMVNQSLEVLISSLIQNDFFIDPLLKRLYFCLCFFL